MLIINHQMRTTSLHVVLWNIMLDCVEFSISSKIILSCWKMAIKNIQIQLFGACNTCIYDSNIFSESSCKACKCMGFSDHILSGIRLSVSLSVRLWTFNIFYFSRTTRPTSTKLGTKHSRGKRIKAKNVLNSSLDHTSEMLIY